MTTPQPKRTPTNLRRARHTAVFALVTGMLFAVSVDAQSQDLMEPTIGEQGGKFGIGFQSSWPAYGISGTYQINQQITAEVVLGFIGVVNSYSARVWYRFKPDVKFDIYAFGGVGAYVYDYTIFGRGRSESVVGIQAGAGIESGLQALLEDEEMPPIFFNLELGLAVASFDNYGGFSLLGLGAGVHYRFGGAR